MDVDKYGDMRLVSGECSKVRESAVYLALVLLYHNAKAEHIRFLLSIV